MKAGLIWIFCFFVLTSCFAQTKVILKLDDVGGTLSSGNRAADVMDYLISSDVKASYGLIANRLDSTSKQLFTRYILAKNSKGEPLVEFWHHGYDHSNHNTPNNLMEFKGTNYAFQKKNFEKADSLVKATLGIQMHTFGAPFNAVDHYTLKVVTENISYRNLFYFEVEPDQSPSLRRLNTRLNMENGVGNPDFNYFVAELERRKGLEKPILVLQGHPLQWDRLKFEEFKKIVSYLLAKKCTFVLPSDFSN